MARSQRGVRVQIRSHHQPCSLGIVRRIGRRANVTVPLDVQRPPPQARRAVAWGGIEPEPSIPPAQLGVGSEFIDRLTQRRE